MAGVPPARQAAARGARLARALPALLGAKPRPARRIPGERRRKMNRAPTFELKLAREIRAPRERVFDAFVAEAAMRQWMCPRGMTIPALEVDARVGGGFRITMRARDGEQFTAVAAYREIARPERLVYTWQWVGEGMPNVETLITVTFAERDGAPLVRRNHHSFPDPATDGP